jgi:N-acetylmuramoyl-L-alanine amidase
MVAGKRVPTPVAVVFPQESIINNPTSHFNSKFKGVPAAKLDALSRLSKFSDMDKKSRKKLVKYSIIAGNVLLLVIVSLFILSNRSASQTVRSSTLNSVNATANSVSNPLDQLSSAQIALTAAQVARLPELTAVRNQADSDSLTLNVVPNDTIAIAKPQIVATGLKSKQDIRHYTTVLNDTVSSLAAKFGVSAESIKWSNDLSGDALPAGKQLSIPPVNGIVYTVKAGDTPASLAARYQADANLIISYNDAEINGLKPGEQVIIPNGRLAAPAVSYGFTPRLSVSSFLPAYGYNGYDYGYCTWYVANKVAVPSNWGNANTWDNYALLSGWTVSSTPVVGAIAQTDAGFQGHVALVEAVSPDGSMMKYSDMNGLAGWGRVGYSDWVPASHFPHYIYH